MPIPSYETIMLPLLELLSDNREHALSDVLERISKKFKLTEKERKELLPSGTEPIIRNRVRWARLYLERARHANSCVSMFPRLTLDRGILSIDQDHHLCRLMS